jgi:GTP pyrophosphokinase
LKDRAENIVPGVTRRRSSAAWRTSIAAVGHEPIAGPPTTQLRLDRRLLCRHRLWRDQSAVSCHAPGRRRRRPEHAPTVAPPERLTRTGGVRVKGVGDLLVRFAKCCHPIPGDPIVGFITRGKGVTVHLQNCPTVVNEREVSRLIEVEWENEPTATYPIAIRVEAYDRTGLLSDITQVVAEHKVNILAAHVGVTPDHTAVVTATLQVASVSQLARVMSRIEQLKDVINVQRDLG